ncbi:hypothetical protein FKM82_014370 [Ascaphus truei]
MESTWCQGCRKQTLHYSGFLYRQLLYLQRVWGNHVAVGDGCLSVVDVCMIPAVCVGAHGESNLCGSLEKGISVKWEHRRSWTR